MFTIKGLIGFSDRCKLICPTLSFMKLAPEVIEILIGKDKTWNFTWDEPISTERENIFCSLALSSSHVKVVV